MNFVIDKASSNVFTPQRPLDITISVTAQDNENFYLKAGEYVYVQNVGALTGEDIQIDFLKNNQSKGKFNKKDGHCFLKLQDKQAYQSFQIHITTKEIVKEYLNGDQVTLTLKFVENGGSEVVMDFLVSEMAEPIGIETFEANRTIIQKNTGSLILNYKIVGDPEEVHLFQEQKTIDPKYDNRLKNGNVQVDLLGYTTNVNHYFTLRVKKGNQQVIKTLCIIYVDQSTSGTRTVSPFITDENSEVVPQPLNICASQDSSCLFALFTYADNNKAKFIMGHTRHTDGDNWIYDQIEDNHNELRYYINSPMVHLLGKNETLGRILFIGGSKIEQNNAKPYKTYASKVGILDLDQNSFSTYDMVQPDGNPIGPVWGHTCVVGTNPHNKQKNTVFRLGGLDNYGTSYGIIYESTDGILWEQSKMEAKGNDCHRVVPTASFYKNKIWIGGGFTSFGEDSIIQSAFEPKTDVNSKKIGYVWKNTFGILGGNEILVENDAKKSVIEGLLGSGHRIKCVALVTYGAPYGVDTGMALIGLNENGLCFYRQIMEDNGYFSLSNDNIKNPISDFKVRQTGTINSAFVNGCLFFNIIYDDGKDGISYSNYMYYYIPVVNTSTINFFKKQ